LQLLKEFWSMEMCCRGKCGNYSPPKRNSWMGEHFRPDIDVRRCHTCGVFIQWSGGIIRKVLKGQSIILERYISKFYCPCCGMKLRSKSRKKTNRTNQNLVNVPIMRLN